MCHTGLPPNETSRLALAAVVLLDISTLVYVPSDTLTGLLSTLTCEVSVEDLHSNCVFFELTTRLKSDFSFLGFGSCTEFQQWASLIREMTKHADETKAEADAYAASIAALASDWDEYETEIDYDQPVSCVAWCFRMGEDDRLLGIMSHPLRPLDLQEMSFCRGEHGYSGDCEERGLRLGFDVTKEGWLNDYLGWVHDAEDGPEGWRWDGNRKMHLQRELSLSMAMR